MKLLLFLVLIPCLCFGAFNATDLTWALSSLYGYQDLTPRVYDYTTSDSLATVETGGYFNAATKTLRPHDLIRVTATDGKAILFVVSSFGSVDASLIVATDVNSF